MLPFESRLAPYNQKKLDVLKALYALIKNFADEWRLENSYSKESSYFFAMHGGCIRDTITNDKVKDYDILFYSRDFMTSFARYIKDNEENLNAKINLSGPRSSAFIWMSSFNFEMQLLDETIILDCVYCHNVPLPLDYTVNGLYINYYGELRSKVIGYSVDDILQHISKRKLVLIPLISNEKKYQYDTFFSQMYGKITDANLFNRVEIDKKAEHRLELMLSKNYTV